MTRDDCLFAAMCATYIAIIAIAGATGITLADLRTDIVMRWIAGFSPAVFG